MKIKFTPAKGTLTNIAGFPFKLDGDGLIELDLKYSAGESAIYRDMFGEEYTIDDPSLAEWSIDIRED